MLELGLPEDDDANTQIWCVADFKLEKTGIIRLLEVVKKNQKHETRRTSSSN